VSDSTARTFLQEFEITRLVIISHSIYRRSRTRNLPSEGSDFRVTERFSPPRSPTDPELFSVKREKAFLQNCRGHCVFFYVTLYDSRWLFLNYQGIAEELFENSSSGEVVSQNSTLHPVLAYNAPLIYNIVYAILYFLNLQRCY